MPVEFRRDLWHQKTRVPGLSCGVVCVILCLAVLVELRLVTDTDSIASCGKKSVIFGKQLQLKTIDTFPSMYTHSVVNTCHIH